MYQALRDGFVYMMDMALGGERRFGTKGDVPAHVYELQR
jgi:hypothetical protein